MTVAGHGFQIPRNAKLPIAERLRVVSWTEAAQEKGLRTNTAILPQEWVKTFVSEGVVIESLGPS